MLNLKGKSIRIKTILSLNVMLLFLSVSIYLILFNVMLDKMEILEEKYVMEHMRQAENGIRNELKKLSRTVADWAHWDDTYEFIKTGNKEYIESNLTARAVSNLDISSMAYLNISGRYVYSCSYDAVKNEIVPASYSFLKYIINTPINGNTDPEYKLNGIITLPEGPMLIASHPILTNDCEGPVPGNLVFGINLDEERIRRLAKDLNLNISIKPLSLAEPSDNSGIEVPVSIKVLGDDKISGTTILRDVYGRPALSLSVELDRDFHAIGIDGIRTVIVLLISSIIVFTLFLMAFIDKNIISRLMKLSEDVRQIGKEKGFSGRLKPQKIQDELALVSDEINCMLDELENSQAQLSESRKALEETNRNLEEMVRQRTTELSLANESLKAEINEREKVQDKIRYLAYHDSLTGLPNRLLFNEQLDRAVMHAGSTGKQLAVMYLDLDSFKVNNDSMGHAFGDILLKEASARLMRNLRESDVIARIGGDEFTILLENIEAAETNAIAERLLSSFNEPLHLYGQDYFITTSIGVAMYPSDGESAEALIKNADIAMYRAKEKGKNQCVFFSPSMKTVIIENLKLSNRLYRAVERNELELYYQPQVSLQTNRIVGVEALLRWNHPELGVIYPDKFIPIAEQTGLIIPIGEWVVRNACKQSRLWQDAGFSDIRMGINLSIRQFQNPKHKEKLRSIIEETGIDPGCLQLEVTESIAMKEKNHIVDALRALKSMGVSIALDDFGTEYSSLSNLKNLPLDAIKIAMPFIHGIGVSDKDKAVTQTIIMLAKSMGLSVIAEGVETESQLEFLKERLCDEVQGYYFSKPVPADQLEKLLITGFGTE